MSSNSESENSPIGEILSELKNNKKKSFRQLEKECGVPNPTIAAILSGKIKEPGFMSGVALAHSLGITADELYWRVKLTQEQTNKS